MKIWGPPTRDRGGAPLLTRYRKSGRSPSINSTCPRSSGIAGQSDAKRAMRSTVSECGGAVAPHLSRSLMATSFRDFGGDLQIAGSTPVAPTTLKKIVRLTRFHPSRLVYPSDKDEVAFAEAMRLMRKRLKAHVSHR